MQITFITAVYVFIIGSLIYRKDYLYALPVILTVPVFIYFKNFLKKNNIKKTTEKIELAKKDNLEGREIIPFINVNKAPWYILELIPTVSAANAKAAALKISRKKIKNFDEFKSIVLIHPVMTDFVRKIVKF